MEKKLVNFITVAAFAISVVNLIGWLVWVGSAERQRKKAVISKTTSISSQLGNVSGRLGTFSEDVSQHQPYVRRTQEIQKDVATIKGDVDELRKLLEKKWP